MGENPNPARKFGSWQNLVSVSVCWTNRNRNQVLPRTEPNPQCCVLSHLSRLETDLYEWPSVGRRATRTSSAGWRDELAPSSGRIHSPSAAGVAGWSQAAAAAGAAEGAGPSRREGAAAFSVPPRRRRRSSCRLCRRTSGAAASSGDWADWFGVWPRPLPSAATATEGAAGCHPSIQPSASWTTSTTVSGSSVTEAAVGGSRSHPLRLSVEEGPPYPKIHESPRAISEHNALQLTWAPACNPTQPGSAAVGVSSPGRYPGVTEKPPADRTPIPAWEWWAPVAAWAPISYHLCCICYA